LWPDPVCPLLASAAPSLVTKALGFSLRGVNPAFIRKIQWVKRFYGRLYFNEGALAYLFTHELGLPDSFIDRALGNRRRDVRPHASRFRLLKFLRRLPIILQLAIRQQSTGKQLERLFPQVAQKVADFSLQHSNTLNDPKLWEEALLWLDYIQQVRNLQLEMTGLSMTAVSTLEQLLLHWLKQQDLARDLIANLAGIEAAEIGSALWQMAQKIRDLNLADVVLYNEAESVLLQLRENAAAAPVLQLLENFLQRHGHRCANEEEWLYPRWAEAPAQVIALLRVYLHPNSPHNPAESALKQRRRREAAMAEVYSHLGWLRRAIFNVVLARAQHAVRLRDNGKNYAMLASLPARRLAALFGERWAQRGWLRQAEDIFFLTFPDIQQIVAAGNPGAAQLDLLKIVAERRAAFEDWFKIMPPEVIDSEGKPLARQTTQAPSENVLRGISISGGRVRGVARVVHDHQELLQVHPGEILVARAADAGWSAIFPILSGLVTEIGGQLSHAAILAREYGLPAVVDVHDATRLIRDGQLISLDGESGVVYLEGAAPA